MGRLFSAILVLLFLVLAGLSSTRITAASLVDVYLYSLPGSLILEDLEEYFGGLADSQVRVCYLNDSRRISEFLQLAEALAAQGVNLVPSEVCTPCELSKGLSWQNIYLEYASPLVLLFVDGRLTSIIIATSNPEVLDEALSGEARVFIRDKTITSIDEEARAEIELMFDMGAVEPKVDLWEVLPLIVLAASADAVNPCEFYVLIVFLSLVVHRLGRYSVLKAGAAYSAAIFTIYFALGLGLVRLIGYVQEAKILVAALGLLMGLRAVLNFVFSSASTRMGLLIGSPYEKFKSIPDLFSRRISDSLMKASGSPVSAFALGLVTGLFLLPCTSGPYLIALILISDLKTQFLGLLLLALYNGIVVAPFLAITIGVHQLRLRTNKLKKWSSTRRRWLNLAGGLIMIGLSLYLLNDLLWSRL